MTEGRAIGSPAPGLLLEPDVLGGHRSGSHSLTGGHQPDWPQMPVVRNYHGITVFHSLPVAVLRWPWDLYVIKRKMVEELSPDSAPGLQRCRAPVFRCTSPVELQPHRPVVPQRPDTGVLQCCCVARLQLCRVAVSRCNGPVKLQPHRPTDGDGNWVRSWRASLVTYGKSQHQAQALIRDAVASVVAYAKEAGKPIVLEKLDFRTRKAAPEGESPRYNRMLSSFKYSNIRACFLSRGCKYTRSTRPSVRSLAGSSSWSVTGSVSTRQRPWCWPDICSAVPSASRADGSVLSAMGSRSPSPYL